ncbi:MFS general substrate transporter [Trametes sanguinea]|nr:MFS general substrate transporter [Trametes sanguinea]
MIETTATQRSSPSSSVEKGSIEILEEVIPEPSVQAYDGRDELPPPPPLTEAEERRIWRKIDVRLLPMLTVMYLVASLDRSNIGNAKLEGLLTQLNLTGNQYNIALVGSSYASLVLKKLRPSKWLPGITLAWGIIAACMGLVKTYPQLLGVRICLGLAEAGLPPGVFYYLTMWYPRHMVQYRIGLFWGGATFAGAFSGLLAFAISFMSGKAGLLGWSWIFIIEGLITIVVAVVAFFVLVDFPHTATFLTPEERAYVVHRKKYDNSSVGEEEHFETRHIWETLLDWKVIVSALINMAVITPVYGITLFLPECFIIQRFPAEAVVVVGWSKWSDDIKMRSPFVLAGLVFCLTGFAINAADVSIGAKYFGTFLVVIGGYAGFPGNMTWLGNNMVGHYRRGVAIGTLVMFANTGGAIACNIYRVSDAPRYLRGHLAEIGFVSMGLLLMPVLFLAYTRENARRDGVQRERGEAGLKAEYTPEELRRLGNRAPDFRFTL